MYMITKLAKQVTKKYSVTFNEPSPDWLCADNLAVALHSHCKNTKFKVKELTKDKK